MPTNLRRLLVLSLVASAGWFVAGCDGNDGIRVYDAPKDPPRAIPARPLTWQLPTGWEEIPDDSGAQFGRVATIQVSEDPAFVLTVSRVQSTDLLSNLNRWEGQVGLTPTSAADAGSKVTSLEVDGHTGQRVDLAGEVVIDEKAGTKTLSRILAVLVPHGEAEAWTFKLQGAPDKVAAQASRFDEFVRSVKFLSHDHGPADPHAGGDATTPAGPTAAADPHASPATAPAAGPADGKTYNLTGYTAPPGWEKDPTERPMRVATLLVGAGDAQAQVMITKLRNNGFGSIENNINRWRGEVGLPAAKPGEAVPSFEKTKVGGENAAVIDFAGPDGPGAKRSTVAMLVKGGDMWFVKLIGPAKTVTDQRANFDAFLQSLQFGEARE